MIHDYTVLIAIVILAVIIGGLVHGIQYAYHHGKAGRDRDPAAK